MKTRSRRVRWGSSQDACYPELLFNIHITCACPICFVLNKCSWWTGSKRFHVQGWRSQLATRLYGCSKSTMLSSPKRCPTIAQHTDLSPRWITSILSISEGYHQHVPGLVYWANAGEWGISPDLPLPYKWGTNWYPIISKADMALPGVFSKNITTFSIQQCPAQSHDQYILWPNLSAGTTICSQQSITNWGKQPQAAVTASGCWPPFQTYKGSLEPGGFENHTLLSHYPLPLPLHIDAPRIHPYPSHFPTYPYCCPRTEWSLMIPFETRSTMNHSALWWVLNGYGIITMILRESSCKVSHQ